MLFFSYSIWYTRHFLEYSLKNLSNSSSVKSSLYAILIPYAYNFTGYEKASENEMNYSKIKFKIFPLLLFIQDLLIRKELAKFEEFENYLIVFEIVF